jgi:drug/metabolite transporter (DMT)-like permease
MNSSGNLRIALLMLLATSLMGSSFAISQMGLHYSSPLFLAGLRFGFAGLLLAPFVLKRRQPAGLRQWGRVALIGLLQTTGVMGAIFLSLTTITAGESAILTFTNPVLVVVLGSLFAGIRYRAVQWLGAGLGLAGVAVAIAASWQLQSGMAWGLASAVFWASSTLLLKRWRGEFDPWVMTAYQMLFGGACLVLLGVALEGPVFQLNLHAAAILAWLVVMASIVQFGAWFYVLHHADPARASAYLFLAPVFGVLFGYVLLGQPIGAHVVLGAALVVSGIWLVNRSHR